VQILLEYKGKLHLSLLIKFPGYWIPGIKTYFTVDRLVGKRSRFAWVAGYKEDQEVQTPRQKYVVQQPEASTLFIVASEHLPHSTVLWIFDKQFLYPYQLQRVARHRPSRLTSSSGVLAVGRVKLCRQSSLSVPHALCRRRRTHT